MPKYELFKKLRNSKSTLFVNKKIVIDKQKQGIWKRRLIGGLILLTMAYIWQINSIATRGYAIKDLEETKSQLLKINQELKIKVTEAQSTQSIMARLEEMEMVPVYNVSYIREIEQDFAVAR